MLRRATPKQATRGDRRFAFALGFLCCVLFPAFVTLIAPITALTLSWDGERVNTSATRFVYIVIPYATTTLADVTASWHEARACMYETSWSRSGVITTFLSLEVSLSELPRTFSSRCLMLVFPRKRR